MGISHRISNPINAFDILKASSNDLLFKEVNCGVECEEHNTNHGEYFPYCEDCDKEQEVFHSKLYDFNIPNNSDSEKLPEEFIKLQINSNDDEKEITQQHIDDDDEVYNNPNLHSKEQDELEIPDDGF
ncbi:unnamed protein product [Rhizophagus irregularis]|nr:unnamed protein product [Rhizophagus irregularis]